MKDEKNRFPRGQLDQLDVLSQLNNGTTWMGQHEMGQMTGQADRLGFIQEVI